MPGPLKTERFRLAKIGIAGDPGAMLEKVFLASAKVGRLPSEDGGGRRDTRMPDGNDPVVGGDGKILTDACGERAMREPDAVDRPDGDASEALDVLDAFE